MRLLTVALSFLALSACIEFDEELVFDTDPSPTDTAGDVRPDRPLQPEEPAPQPQGILDPDSGALCDILLVSLTTDDPTGVDTVSFFGPSGLRVLAMEDRPGEILLTVQISESGAEGMNDLLISFADGEALFVEDAFEVAGEACG